MGQRQDSGHPEEGAPVAHPCQLEVPAGPLRARLGVSFPSPHPCHAPGKCPLECLLMSQEQAAQGANIPCTKWRERRSSQESRCRTIGTTSQCLPTASSAPGCGVSSPQPGSRQAVFLLLATLYLCLPLQSIPLARSPSQVHLTFPLEALALGVPEPSRAGSALTFENKGPPGTRGWSPQPPGYG